MQLVAIGEGMLARSAVRRLLGELRVLDEECRGVDPHTGDAAIEPEAEHVLVLGPDLGVCPVEVGMLRREEVEVPLVAFPGPRPGGTAEDRLPVVGRAAPAGPMPDRNQKRSRSREPGGDARASRNHACWSETWLGTTSTIVRSPSSRASRMSSSASTRGAEVGIDRAIVGDVVPGVGEGRRVPRAEPEGVDAEVAEVRQSARGRRRGLRFRRRSRRRSCGRRPGRRRAVPPPACRAPRCVARGGYGAWPLGSTCVIAGGDNCQT